MGATLGATQTNNLRMLRTRMDNRGRCVLGHGLIQPRTPVRASTDLKAGSSSPSERARPEAPTQTGRQGPFSRPWEPRRAASREIAQFVARQLVIMPEPVRPGRARAPGQGLFSQLTGQDSREWLDTCATALAA